VWIWNGKLCGRTLKVYQVQYKPNLGNIFKPYLNYHYLEILCNSFEYFQRLWKKLFVVIRQFGLPTFFVIFTFTERLWDPFIKVFHTLHASRLIFSNKIKDLQFVCTVELIRINPVTCARYYDKTFCFHKLITKDHYFLGIYIYIYILSLNSKIMVAYMTMDFYQ